MQENKERVGEIYIKRDKEAELIVCDTDIG